MQRNLRSSVLATHGGIPVWDIGVRAFHWLLVIAVTASALTGFVLGATTLTWHLVAGISVIALLVWRLGWGAWGTTYARFASFAYPPAAVLEHLRGFFRGYHRRHLGHNPLGALMVFALIAVLAVIVLAGTITLGGMLKQGPLRAFLTYATGRQWLHIHKLLAIALLAMIGLHLAGVAWESWRGRENLTLAMFTGGKPREPEADTVPPKQARPRSAFAVVLGVLALGTAATLVLSALPGLGVPPAALDPVFDEQCGSCHLAYSPSLAPASTWQGLLADLKHHFTADATLTPEMVTHLRAYLDANDATHWDTLPSHLFRVPAPNGSLRITDTPGWQRAHRDIPERVFASKPVRRKSACEACHADAATGMFAPQSVAIPAGAQ
jgi:cytochrome b